MQPRISLGAIAYQLGERRSIDDLDFLRGDARRLELYRLAGFEAYAESELSMRELAVRSARQTLETTPIGRDELGVCLYVAESFERDEPVSSAEINRMLVDLDLTHAVPIHISAANCANIVAALRVAAALIAGGGVEHVLIASVDKASRRPGGRRMFQEMSIKSDVSVSCVVSRGAAGAYELLDLGQDNLAGLIEVIDEPVFATQKLKEIRRVARRARERLGLGVGDFARVITNNYGREVMRMFVELCGFPRDAGWYGNLGRFAHAVAGDVLINLKDVDARGDVHPGDRLLLVADSITSSATVCVRRQ